MLRLISVILCTFLFSTQAHAGLSDKELKCLALNAYHEARGEGILGIIAVMDVTMNRVESSRYPNSVCAVVYQRAQFSWTLDPVSVKNVGMLDAIQSIAYVVGKRKVYRGVTNGSLWYHANSVRPKWAKSFKVSRVIKNHTFYIAQK